MKITGSSVQLGSSGYYSQVKNSGTGAGARRTGYSSMSEHYFGGEAGFSEGLYADYTKNGLLRDGVTETEGAERSASVMGDATGTDLRDSLLKLLLTRLAGIRSIARAESARFPSSGFRVGASGVSYLQVDYREYEEMSFQAAGQAVTEDGRILDFAANLYMSREFMLATQMTAPRVTAILMDPLVVNVGSAVTNVSDQTFRFDLDADGAEEDVAMLKGGSGFLALDKNGDGIVNDGSELFGALSGDGFGDLRRYDSDGNGWIDENDPVFSKLKVWYKNGDGEDTLVDLKEADVGAIFLGEQQTDFHLTDEGNRLHGMVRSTGIFLRESGGVGTVQHVDLAVRRDGEERATVNGAMSALEIGGENFVSGYGTGDAALRDEVIVLRTGDGVSGESETADSRSSSARAEREQLRREAAKRREERRARNEELAEKARERREEEEARVEQLFEERLERREDEEEQALKTKARHRAFEEAFAGRREMREQWNDAFFDARYAM